MPSKGLTAIVAGVAAASTINAQAAAYEINQMTLPPHGDDNVVTLAQAGCQPCDAGPHQVKIVFERQPFTNVDFLDSTLGPALEKSNKNALILLSDRPYSENREKAELLRDVAERMFRSKGVKIHYVMYVFPQSKTPSPKGSLEGTVRLYQGGFMTDIHPKTGQLMRTVQDIEYMLNVAAPKLQGIKMPASASTGTGSTGSGGSSEGSDGSNSASTGVQPPQIALS